MKQKQKRLKPGRSPPSPSGLSLSNVLSQTLHCQSSTAHRQPPPVLRLSSLEVQSPSPEFYHSLATICGTLVTAVGVLATTFLLLFPLLFFLLKSNRKKMWNLELNVYCVVYVRVDWIYMCVCVIIYAYFYIYIHAFHCIWVCIYEFVCMYIHMYTCRQSPVVTLWVCRGGRGSITELNWSVCKPK